jgi:Ca2+-transporting ATPase
METARCFDHAASIVTRCPGRLRIAIPALYRSQSLQGRIETDLSTREHIHEVHASPLTGKVLILFDPAVAPERMLHLLGWQPPAGKNESPKARNAEIEIIYPPWHLRDATAALEYHDSSAQSGLSGRLAEQRLREGRNLLPQRRGRSALEILLGQFKSLPVLLLGVSALLAMLTGGLAEALAIAAVLGLNAAIGYASERRAESTIASLSELVDDIVPVIRDGQYREVPASHIVAGDLLVLAPGTRVAADARVVQANELSVDESALTGESHFVAKSSAALPHPVAMADRSNMTYMGTAVTAGTGLAVVVGTAGRTEIGVIQRLMNRTEQPGTPLQKELDRLGNRLIAASLAICAAVFAIGLLRGFARLHMLKAAISLAIAAVPEGLPTVATTSLARGIRRMRERQMLVRRLQAVETLGAIHTICLDKTGTLTMNRMSVVAVCTATQEAERGEDASGWQAVAARRDAHPELARLLQVCVLCNENEAHNNGAPAAFANGSATENALIEFARGAGIDVSGMRARHALLHAELRSAQRSYMKCVRALDPGRRLIAVKGNPAEVLALCGTCQHDGQTAELTQQRRDGILAQNERMAERQLRVLGFAYAETAAGGAEDNALTWIGLVGLADPLRAGARRVIEALHDAGVRTTMVTGDQGKTAYAVGKSLALHNGADLHILDADRLEQTAPEDLRKLAAQAHIFARVSPARKLQIVQALQNGGEVVAMTGDGINDGPALRAADVGIAMGLHGTDLARSAADVVLKDDRLETVLEAIREGRTITVNIRKSLHFLISSNLSEILMMLGAISAGMPAPLTPMQLLWLNLLSDVLPAVALAAEAAEEDVMRQPPRDASKPMIGRSDLKHYTREGLLIAGGSLASYGYALARYGAGGRAGAIAFNTLILGQMLHALSCRSERHGLLSASNDKGRGNRLNQAIAGSLGLQALAGVVPGLRRLLGIAPPGVADLLVILAGAGVPLLLNEGMKRREGEQGQGLLPSSPRRRGSRASPRAAGL